MRKFLIICGISILIAVGVVSYAWSRGGMGMGMGMGTGMRTGPDPANIWLFLDSAGVAFVDTAGINFRNY
jgi:hypothetical protein